jgi:hypothetical protein
VAAYSGAVDRHVRERGGRTNLDEMAQMAAVENLTALVARLLVLTLGAMPEEDTAASMDLA